MQQGGWDISVAAAAMLSGTEPRGVKYFGEDIWCCLIKHTIKNPEPAFLSAVSIKKSQTVWIRLLKTKRPCMS